MTYFAKALVLAGLYLTVVGSFLLAMEAIGVERVRRANRATAWMLGSRYETPHALLLALGMLLAVGVGYWRVRINAPSLPLQWPPSLEVLAAAGLVTPFLVFAPVVTVHLLRVILNSALHANRVGVAGLGGFALVAAGSALQAAATIMS